MTKPVTFHFECDSSKMSYKAVVATPYEMMKTASIETTANVKSLPWNVKLDSQWNDKTFSAEGKNISKTSLC